MKKKVNVYPYTPIKYLKTEIIGPTLNVEMSVGDILRCLCAKARVEEILEDGSKVSLNFKNYNKNNEPAEKASLLKNEKTTSQQTTAKAEPKQSPKTTASSPQPNTQTASSTTTTAPKQSDTNKVITPGSKTPDTSKTETK